MGMREKTEAFIRQLKGSPGETVQERTDVFLRKRGWDKRLNEISDDDFRAFIREAVERLALRQTSSGSARDIEQEKWRKETKRIAESGILGDLFADQYRGMEAAELIKRLPRETYWVESLGRHLAREELIFELEALAELRNQARSELTKIEANANVVRHELAIFLELIRQNSMADA